MDPTATLAFMLEALQERDTESARAYLGYLCEFIDRGGFTPSAVAKALAALD